MDTQIANIRLKFKRWPELRRKYIYEWASLLDLSKEYDGQISYNAVADRCKAEGWVQQRQDHWAQVGQDYGALITAKKIEAQKMMIEGANMLIKSSKEAIEKYIANLEGKGEDMSLKEARDLMWTGFRMISYFMDKVDNDPQYSNGVTDADKYETLRWMKAYFGLYHSLTDEEKKQVGNDTSNMLEVASPISG